MNELTRLNVMCSLAAMIAIGSAIACIYAKHQSRKMFTELQALMTERDELEVDWGRLQIEQSTWSTHARVERLARTQMQMRDPQPDEIRLVQP